MSLETRSGVRGAAKRLAWFVGLWLGGVAAVGALALALRFILL